MKENYNTKEVETEKINSKLESTLETLVKQNTITKETKEYILELIEMKKSWVVLDVVTNISKGEE